MLTSQYLEINKALRSARVGLEFEFYSRFDRFTTAHSISKFLKKRIILSRVYHSKRQPTDKVFKIERDYSGGKELLELVTGILSYEEAKEIIKRMYQWIMSNGITTDRCSVHLNISFDRSLPLKLPINNLNVLKFILNYDEDFVYARFPLRRNSVYARSIKNLIPHNRFSISSDLMLPYRNSFMTPKTKYYGVNFSKMNNNYLEVRYCGGENYEGKLSQVLEVLDYTISKLYEVCNSEDDVYTESQIHEFHKLIAKHKRFASTLGSYQDFKTNYGQTFSLMANLSSEDSVVNAYYDHIKNQLFDIMSNCDFEQLKNQDDTYFINYDSDASKIQVKDARVSQSHVLEDIEFVNCEILGGYFEKCLFYDCRLKSASLTKCSTQGVTKIEDSKILKTIINEGTTVLNSYVNNRGYLFNGAMVQGVLSSAVLGKDAQIDRSVMVINHRIGKTIDGSGAAPLKAKLKRQSAP